MKKLIALALVFVLVLSACSNWSVEIKDPQSGSESPKSASGSAPEIDFVLSEEEKETAREQAKDFAVNFSSEFEDLSGLDNQTVGYFLFWKIYNNSDFSADDGYYTHIPLETLRSYAKDYFGAENWKYEGDIPEYSAEDDSLLFYPGGGGYRYTAEILEESYDFEAGEAVYRILLTHVSIGEGTPKIKTLNYTFKIVKNERMLINPLRAVLSESDAEKEKEEFEKSVPAAVDFNQIDVNSGEEADFKMLSEEKHSEFEKLIQSENWEKVPADWQGMGGLTGPVTVFADGSGYFLYFSTEPNYEKTLVQIKKQNEQVCWFAPKEVAEDMESFRTEIAGEK